MERDLAPESAKLGKDVQRAEDTRGGPGSMGFGGAFPESGGRSGPRLGGGGRLEGTQGALSHGAQRDHVSLRDAPELGNTDCSVFVNNLKGTWCQQK